MEGADAARAPTGIGSRISESWKVWMEPMAKGLVWSNCTDSTKCDTKSGGTMNYTRLLVGYSFYAADGSSVRAVVAGEAMDSADKSTNKAMSAALKYALLQIFCVPTEMDDADAETHEMGDRSARQEQSAARAEKANGSESPGQLIPKLKAAYIATGKSDAEWGKFFASEKVGSMGAADIKTLIRKFTLTKELS
mgnify:CR=1 FL=1